MSDARPPAELLHGVSLEQYAGVAAALTEGFPLAAILADEQIAPDVWPKADTAWKARVARDGAAGPIFADLCAKRAVAEDCLARGVAPIDADLGAWMSFLGAYGAHPAPAQMLEGAGLGVNDLSRLQRRWARRMAEDTSLSKQAAELAKKGLGPLPALRVEPAKRTPFPWSKGRAPEAVKAAPRVAAPAETSMAPGKLRLYSYVAVKARLAESPGKEQEVLEQLGLKDFAATDAGWQAVLAGDPEVARDYRQLLAAQRARLGVAGKQGSPVQHASRAESAPAPAAPLPEVAAGDAVAPAIPAAMLPRHVPGKLAGTSLAVDVPRKLVLPFGESAPAPATSMAPAAPTRPAPPRDLSGTSMALDLPLRSALPFPAAQAPPVPPPGPPGEGRTLLTLEQHASLCCELAEAPEQAMEALARYRITPADKQAADQHYAARFERQPGVRTAWDAAYATYRAWWLAGRVSR